MCIPETIGLERRWREIEGRGGKRETREGKKDSGKQTNNVGLLEIFCLDIQHL